MKLIFGLVCLVLYVIQTAAQCRGVPSYCTGPRNVGNNNSQSCRRNANPEMWWYDSSSRSCRRMSYLGCGGNSNRFCSLAACQSLCGRY